ncbi:MAG: glycosyltransferase [Actinomadura sp.]
MAPRILVDATAAHADRGALGRYVDGLIAALDAAGTDLAVTCQRSDLERYEALAPRARVVAGPAAVAHRATRLAWEQTGLPVVAGQVGADVVHLPYYTMPNKAGRPTVVTVHDVAFFSEPESYDPVRSTYIKSATRTACRRATRVIVPSKATRDGLVPPAPHLIHDRGHGDTPCGVPPSGMSAIVSQMMRRRSCHWATRARVCARRVTSPWPWSLSHTFITVRSAWSASAVA